MSQSSEQDAGAPREKEMAKFTRELAGRQSPLGKIKPLACAAPALKKKKLQQVQMILHRVRGGIFFSLG